MQLSKNVRPYPAYEPPGVERLGDVPAHWYVPSSVKISFTRYSYKPQPLRSLDEIRADIPASGAADGGIASGDFSWSYHKWTKWK